ncbi:MAG: sn-glycerol-3-phosphate ABC transporter ATP-binding protein UgpC [Myxococcota bacterium]|nr:sn-glycerol-3-phosphate ABC transporter ATP-binding protein UgpC [Myxococcota bacterium]
MQCTRKACPDSLRKSLKSWEQAKRPIDKNLREQAKRPIDKNLREQAKRTDKNSAIHQQGLFASTRMEVNKQKTKLMAGVSMRGIIKQYGTASPTLKGIDLDIQDGEFLVLVGPSGCGKSTLLRIIAGLESITKGELKIDGRMVNTVAPKDRDIAMVFQSYALYPHMTVRRNMSFGLEVRRVAREEIDTLVNEAAEMLGLTVHLDKLPKMLSGGQRQRVAMGRAIVRRPKVYLFDEPLSNLDAALRTQMRVEIRRNHRKLATTTVYVTHDQIEAMTLADRIAVLDKGILQQVGTPMQLFQTPANKFVAGFIGSPAMNFLDATLQINDGERHLLVESGKVPLPEGFAPKLEDGQKLILGLRPQELLLATGEPQLTATVDVVETLGWESHVHAKLGKNSLLAVLEAKQALHLKADSKLGLEVPPTALHLFDPKSEEAIAHGIPEERPKGMVEHVDELESGDSEPEESPKPRGKGSKKQGKRQSSQQED